MAGVCCPVGEGVDTGMLNGTQPDGDCQFAGGDGVHRG
jgi:hypothetical protein